MGYGAYVLKRVLLIVPILFGVSFISFGALELLPGGPVEAAFGTRANPELVEQLRQQYGLNRPFLVRYFDWLGDIVLNQDFGQTIRTERDVSTLLATSLPPTIWLAASGAFVSVVIGIPAGIVSAVNHYEPQDYLATFLAFLGLSIPNFFLGLVLILVFSLYVPIFPSSGFVSPLSDPAEGLKTLVLPAVTVGTAISAVVMRMMRSSLLEVFSEEYIRTARAKGLSRALVTNKHAVKNALIPTVTVVGLNFGYLLGGVVIVEQIFAIPGLGRLTLTAILTREYRVLQGSLLVIALLFALVNLATDLLYAYLDPRIKYD
ncbi:ABC transporter permease [Salinirubellus salinus]|uniref:ABC transporter permease n=1 Tax=Salinirubellus salinus TaxID=1364945 RepID=A0A9E7U775_9EURY|nr:ABC transporter permease [Salinirubellus salinus]UWM53281.1 ABC transporter permease [Salinirubellus salinus]